MIHLCKKERLPTTHGQILHSPSQVTRPGEMENFVEKEILKRTGHLLTQDTAKREAGCRVSYQLEKETLEGYKGWPRNSVL